MNDADCELRAHLWGLASRHGSRKALADRIGVHHSNLYRYLSGRQVAPSRALGRALARHYPELRETIARAL